MADVRSDLLVNPRLGRLILGLAWPVVASLGLHSLFTIVDLFWVGRFSTPAVAAVSSAIFVTWSIVALGQTISVGVLSVTARLLGSGRGVDAARTAWQGFFWAGVLGVAVGAAMQPIAPALYDIMTGDPEVRRLGITYLRVIGAFAPAWYTGLVFQEVFRASGDTRTPFLVLGTTVLFNFALDPLFILGPGPFPRWGVGGAALVSGVSHVLGVALYLAAARWGRRPVPFAAGRAGFRPDARALRELCSVGGPMTLVGVVFSAVYVFMSRVASAFGTPTLAALGLVNRIESMAYLTIHGLGIATATLVGQNLGAGAIDRAGRIAARANAIGMALGAAAMVVFLLLPGPLMRLFTEDPETVREGTRFMRIISWCQVLQAWELVLEGAFAGAGRTLPAMLVSVPMSLVRVPAAWIVAGPLGFGPDGIWWTISVTAALRGILIRWWWGRGSWRFPRG